MNKWYTSKVLYVCIFIVVLLVVVLFLQHVRNKPQPEVLLTKPSITIINPIRGNELGLEKADLLASLKAQWQVTDGLPATWLWQYSALEDEQLVHFAKSEMKGQEFGVFLEIDRNTAKKAGVQYRGQGPWYFSDGVFLIAYDTHERKKLIDEIFSLFKKQFGYYPKTVGAWWIGGDSLTYMQQKYGIVAALKASDQYDLDVYSLWGSPWSIPYVASKGNEGIPAGKDDSSQVVILQWAARDPTEGYENSTYSVQDFFLNGYDFSYVDYLFTLFLQKPMDNIVVGLENGGDLAGFKLGYGKYVQKAKELETAGKVDVLLAGDYATRFLVHKKTFSDNRYFLTKGYKSQDESFWYNSENFRAVVHKIGNDIYLTDLRDYSQKVKEEFSLLPNSQGYLRVIFPSIVDSMSMPSEKILIAKGSGDLTLNEQNYSITLLSGDKQIARFTDSSLEVFLENQPSQFFTFQTQSIQVNLFIILLGVFFFYFLVIFFQKKNLKTSLIQYYLLFIPLFLAFPFLSNGAFGDLNMIFDRKQLWLFSFLPLFSSLTLSQSFVLIQIIPFLALLVMHYFSMIKFPGIWKKRIYFVFFIGIVLLYAHVPYFPLDRSTYPYIAGVFILIALILLSLSFVILRKTHSKKLLLISLVSIPVIFVIIASLIYISRTRLIVTPFEMQALQVIQDKQKEVVFISQTNYGVRPIYKAIKPLLYENYQFGEKITGTSWELLAKTESMAVNVSQYSDKLIIVPRYLGADLSEEQMKQYSFKKVFDNGQIAIFEK